MPSIVETVMSLLGQGDEMSRTKQTKLRMLRGVPASVKAVLEQLPASSHPMDVMRTAVSVLGCALPEKDDHNAPGARDIADRMMASLGSMLLYWYHYSTNGRRIEVETDEFMKSGGSVFCMKMAYY